MTDLLAARYQMALSLGFHILFAVVGIGMPLLMVIAEGLWLRTTDPTYLVLAKRWAKGTAIMFAVGAVSGTVLSFELGLLWPAFMEFAGPIVGMPFSLEGFAFFFEAIFLGIYLYGWNKIGRVAHWLAGVGVMVSGALSGIFVVSANAWMNSPEGFEIDPTTGEVTVFPLQAMFNSAMPSQTLHMTMAAFVSMAFLAAGIHAFYLRKNPNNLFHRRAYGIALGVAIVTCVLQPMTGHVAAEYVAHAQPVKLAAAEAQWETERGAPLRLLGWPDVASETTSWDIEIPYALSILAFGDPHAEVLGLKAFPKEDRPPVAIVHAAYQVMLGLGMSMMGTGLLGAFLWWRSGGPPDHPWYLALVTCMAPAGMIAVEAGWTVTEVGRQPWVIRGILRTADAVTPVPGIALTLWLYVGLYVFLGVMTVLLLRRQVIQAPDVESPYDALEEVS